MLSGRRAGFASLAMLLTLALSPGARSQQSDTGPTFEEESRQQAMRILQITELIESGKLGLSDLSQALRLRGVLYSSQLQHERALQDFNRSIELAPEAGDVYVDRGVLHHTIKRYDKALADFGRAIQLVPDYAHAYYSRGHLNYYQGRFEEAGQDFADGMALAAPNDYLYGVLWRYLATVRLSGDAQQALRADAHAHDLGPWPGPVVRLFLGELTPQEVLALAKGDDRQSARMQRCEAEFYVGQHYLLKGERQSARDAFQKTLATNVKMYIEYLYALVELERLAR